MSDHDRHRDLAAAYVLAALEPTDRAEFEDRLATCQRCRDELVELAPLPGLLGRVPVDDLVDVSTAPSDAVVAGARTHLAGLRTSRRRWRLAAGSAAAVALLLAGVVLADRDAPSGPGEREHVTLVLDAAPPIDGTIAADERAWGTYLHVSLDGLPPRDLYRMWAIDTEGGWHGAGTWAPTPDGTVRLGGSTHLRLAEVDLVVVTSGDRSDRVLEATSRPAAP